MDQQRFDEIMTLDHELTGVEFKGPAALGKGPYLAKVVRAILSMANNRGGGSVVVGVDDQSMTLIPTWSEAVISEIQNELLIMVGVTPR